MSRERYKFFGGRVCLDFANSLNWRLTDEPVELIPDYLGFLHWSGHRNTLPARAIEALRAVGEADHERASAVMTEAHRLRGDLIEVAEALRLGAVPDVGFLDDALSGLPPQPRLLSDGGRFVFDLDGSDLRQPLWPVLWSLTALLASGDAARVGSCQARGCGWFFVDESPNRSRHWCSEGCGNRERVRRSHLKRRGGGGMTPLPNPGPIGTT